MSRDSLHLGQHIDRPAAEVYAFASDPANLPRWVAGLALAEVRVTFVPANEHLVLDHDVTLPSGETVTNPMRVIADDEGCEVVFTLRRAPGMSDADLEADATAVRADLATLRDLLEGA